MKFFFIHCKKRLQAFLICSNCLFFVSTYWHIDRQSNQSTPATNVRAWDNNHTSVCTFNTYLKNYDGHAYVPQLLGNTKI